MQGFLAELRDKAWIATGLMAVVAVGCATMRLDFLAATALMAAGVLIMWKSEEETGEEPSILARLSDVTFAEAAVVPPPFGSVAALPATPAPALAPLA